MSDDVDVVEAQLSRFLDEGLAKDIAQGKKDWEELDYEDIKRSEERRNANCLSVRLNSECLKMSYLISYIVSNEKERIPRLREVSLCVILRITMS